MDDVNIIDRAKEFATKAHLGQVRKFGEGRLYIYHPEHVYNYLALRMPDREELLAAAWLHDVIEDCGVSFGELDKLFGNRVATLVWEVSHPETPEGMPRCERWQIYLEHYASASEEGKILELADRYCNLREYVDFCDSVLEKEWKFIHIIHRKETLELIKRIGESDMETTVKILTTMLDLEVIYEKKRKSFSGRV